MIVCYGLDIVWSSEDWDVLAADAFAQPSLRQCATPPVAGTLRAGARPTTNLSNLAHLVFYNSLVGLSVS
jgi:hypothetical protein